MCCASTILKNRAYRPKVDMFLSCFIYISSWICHHIISLQTQAEFQSMASHSTASLLTNSFSSSIVPWGVFQIHRVHVRKILMIMNWPGVWRRMQDKGRMVSCVRSFDLLHICALLHVSSYVTSFPPNRKGKSYFSAIVCILTTANLAPANAVLIL